MSDREDDPDADPGTGSGSDASPPGEEVDAERSDSTVGIPGSPTPEAPTPSEEGSASETGGPEQPKDTSKAPETDRSGRQSDESGSEEPPDDGGRFGAGRPVTYLTWAGVGVLAVTALVALFGFYTGVSRAITVWVSSSYRPVVNAAFNLTLLLAALGGIGLLLRRSG